MKTRPTRVLVVAAAGRDCSVAQNLLPQLQDCRVHYLATRRTRPMVDGGRVSIVHERLGLLSKPAVALQVLWVLLKVRPQMVFAMDTLPGVCAIRIARRLFGAMTCWLDEHAAPAEADLHADLWLPEAAQLA